VRALLDKGVDNMPGVIASLGIGVAAGVGRRRGGRFSGHDQ